MSPQTSIPYLIPEIILVLVLVSILISSLWERVKQSRFILVFVSLIGLFLCFISIYAQDYSLEESVLPLFGGLIILDSFSSFIKIIILLSAFLTLVSVIKSYEIKEHLLSEFCVIMMSLVLALFLFVSSNNLLMLYLSLEFVSITSYVLTGFKKEDQRASEAALKYVIYGGVVSGIMLFGISYFYGLFGTLDMIAIQEGLIKVFSGSTTVPTKILVLSASLFTFAGIGFKIAAVPFHMWSPDVYEGAPTPFTAFLSVAPKLAGIAVLIRFIFTGFVSNGLIIGDVPWPEIIGGLSIVTMFVGNLSALTQKNMKRFLAYSGIAHCGYLLMGVSAMSPLGLFSVNFYALIYLLMNFGVFIIVIAVMEESAGEKISDYSGLASRNQFFAAALSIFLLSLAGIPPFAGFIGKFYLFSALIQKGTMLYYFIALAGIINSVIALYFYAAIVRLIYFGSPEKIAPLNPSRLFTWVTIVLLIPTIILGIYWQPIAVKAKQSVYISQQK